MLTNAVNVAIVDHSTLFRKMVKYYVSEHNNIQVVAHSPDMPDLLHKLKDACVHVLVIDLAMLKMDGGEAVRFIREEYPNIKILVLTMFSDLELLSDLLDLGVYGILSKTDEPEELIRAIISLSEHRIYRNKLFTEAMYWHKQNTINKYTNSTSIILSEREMEILQLIWEEKSNKEIANHLYLSVRSVEKIRKDMKEKLGVKSTVGMLKYAINKKIISVYTLPLYGFAGNRNGKPV